MILVLKGHIIDIVTSNPFLAIRDEEESKELFNKFDISVANNINSNNIINLKSQKDIYSCDVIFGTTLEYQGDILRDEYKLIKIRNNRKFDVVIVDEIDCMLVDQYNHSTLLSTSIPFMENYSVILQLFWACYKRLKLDDEQILNDNELQEKLTAYLKKNVESIINKTFKAHYLIPMSDNSREFAFDQIDIWIDNFFSSLKCQKKVEYIINEKGEIIPVDNKITGVICKNSVYCDGFSQFLQLKNDLPVTPYDIITNYLSNFGFFRRYKRNSNNIYGLTGTIGDSQTMKILEILYELDFDYIPPENIRILKELESKICFCHSLWLENIKNIVKRETNGNRAVLILSESIENADEIYEDIQKNISGIYLVKIIGEDSEEHLIKRELDPKSVIVSTNISGRGTDIKLKKDVIDNGGLHVIITFIPDNIRVEEQNYGRAGRKGEPGTWQLVINYQNIIQDFELKELYTKYMDLNQKYILTENYQLYEKLSFYFSIDYLRKLREDKTNNLFQILIKDILRVGIEDELFNNYVKIINQRKELREHDNKIYLDSIEEQWGIFAYNFKKENKKYKQLENDYNNFQNKIKQLENEFNNFKNKIFLELDKNKDNLIKNPGFCNKYINSELVRICDKKRNNRVFDEIVEIIKSFVDLDFIFDLFNLFKSNDSKKYLDICNISISIGYDNSFIPFYLRAICRIIFKENENENDEIINDLENSIIIINKEIHRYSYIYKLLKNMNINSDFPFYQMIILSNLKISFEKNLKDFNKMKDSDIILDKINLSNLILQNNKNNNRFNYNLGEYEEIIEGNGLKYIFQLDEKSFIWKFRDFFVELSKLFISCLISPPLEIKDIIGLVTKLPFKDIFKKIHNKFFKKDPDKELELKNEEYYFDKDFQIFEEDIEFSEYLKNRKNIKIYKEYDLYELLKEYDNNLDKNSELIEEELSKVYMKKNVDKLCLFNKDIELDKVLDFVEKIDNDNNILNEKIDKCNNELKKFLDKDKTKSLLETYFLRLVGKDVFSNGYKNLNYFKEKMNTIIGKEKLVNLIIIQGIQNQINKHIEEQKGIWNSLKTKLNEKSRELQEKKIKLSNKILNYNSKREAFNEKVDSANELIKINNEINNKECEDVIENFKKFGEDLKNESEQIELDKKNIEIESNNINKEIEDCNKLNGELNNKINISNNLKDNIIIDFDKDSINIKFKSAGLKIPEFENIFKKFEENLKLIVDGEIKRISESIVYEENNKIIIDKIVQFEEIIEKIINEKNQLFNNCFNKSFSKNNYLYDSNDMNKIINYNLNKILKDSYYISEIYDKNIFDQAKKALENRKIVFGNFLNDYNIWVSFCLIPKHSPYTFLYKSSNGENPSYDLKDFVKNITGDYYIEKINKININNNEELTEVDAIENVKIMIQEIQKDKNEFINNFEKFNNFYTGTKNNKEELKYKIYPTEYVKSLYNEIKIKTNSTRISLGLFKYYYLDREKNNPIIIEYLDKIYEILMNNKEIENQEKDILKQEYDKIKNVYEQNKINEEEKLKKELKKKKEGEKIMEDLISSPIIEKKKSDNNDDKSKKEEKEEKDDNDDNKKKEEEKSDNKDDKNKKEEKNDNSDDKNKEKEINNNNDDKNVVTNNKVLKNDIDNNRNETENKLILDDNKSINKEKDIYNEKDSLKQKNSINIKNQLTNENIKLKTNYEYNSSERLINYRISNQNEIKNEVRQKGCLDRFCDCLKFCCCCCKK